MSFYASQFNKRRYIIKDFLYEFFYEEELSFDHFEIHQNRKEKAMETCQDKAEDFHKLTQDLNYDHMQ